MKRLIFLLAAVAGVSFANAQKVSEKNVPAVVKSALQKKYLHAKELKWEKEDSNYEANFYLGKTNYSVLINLSGKIVETEHEISISALLPNIHSYIARNYAGKKIKEAAKIIDANGVTTYEAEVSGRDLIFDQSGKFLNMVKH